MTVALQMGQAREEARACIQEFQTTFFPIHDGIAVPNGGDHAVIGKDSPLSMRIRPLNRLELPDFDER